MKKQQNLMSFFKKTAPQPPDQENENVQNEHPNEIEPENIEIVAPVEPVAVNTEPSTSSELDLFEKCKI